MPWPPKQRTAIFLDVKRRKGEQAALNLMHEAGYGGDKPKPSLHRSLRKRKRGR